MTKLHIPVSVLNLVPLRQGQGIEEAIDGMLELAMAVQKVW